MDCGGPGHPFRELAFGRRPDCATGEETWAHLLAAAGCQPPDDITRAGTRFMLDSQPPEQLQLKVDVTAVPAFMPAIWPIAWWTT